MPSASGAVTESRRRSLACSTPICKRRLINFLEATQRYKEFEFACKSAPAVCWSKVLNEFRCIPRWCQAPLVKADKDSVHMKADKDSVHEVIQAILNRSIRSQVCSDRVLEQGVEWIPGWCRMVCDIGHAARARAALLQAAHCRYEGSF